MQALGAPLVPVSINLLRGVTSAVLFLEKEVAAHPDAVKWIGAITAGVAAFAVALGAFAIGGAALGALGVLSGPIGFTAIAAGLTGMAAALGHFKWIADIWNANPMGLNKVTPEDLWNRILNGPASIQPQAHDAHGAHSDIHNQSYAPPTGSGPRVQTVVYLQLDKRTIAKAVSEEQAHAMLLPPSGPTRFDNRMSPSFPGTTLPL
ncbi:MAG: hypothetical protein KGL52_01150 [Rhodospirillales bacterium]|nr:hypothetical protein [Rhodospirillales bacterium]